MKPFRFALILGASALLGACDQEGTLIVQSDTRWNGGIFGPRGSRFVDGQGDAQFTFTNESCMLFQKETAGGSLRVYVTGGSPLSPFAGFDELTADEFGEISNC